MFTVLVSSHVFISAPFPLLSMSRVYSSLAGFIVMMLALAPAVSSLGTFRIDAASAQAGGAISASLQAFPAGNQIQYRVTVVNNNAGGPLMPGATVVTNLPGGLRFISGNFCSSTNQTTVTCTIQIPLHQNGETFNLQFGVDNVQCGQTYNVTSVLSGSRGQPGGIAPFTNVQVSSNTTSTSAPACPATPAPQPQPQPIGQPSMICDNSPKTVTVRQGETGQTTFTFSNQGTGIMRQANTVIRPRASFNGNPSVPGLPEIRLPYDLQPGQSFSYTVSFPADNLEARQYVIVYETVVDGVVINYICGGPVNVTATQPQPTIDAMLCDNSPKAVEVRPGETGQTTFVFNNRGTSTWSGSRYAIRPLNGYNNIPSFSGLQPISIPGQVLPNGTFSFTVLLPESRMTRNEESVVYQLFVDGSPVQYECGGVVRKTSVTTTPAGLTISKSGPGSVQRGSTLTYNVTVQNTGGTSAINVAVTDPIPSGLQYQDASSSAECNQEGSSVMCVIGTLPAGQSRSFNLAFSTGSADAASCVPATILNVAMVTSTNAQPRQSSTVATSLTCAGTPVTPAPPAAPTTITNTNNNSIVNTVNPSFNNYVYSAPQPQHISYEPQPIYQPAPIPQSIPYYPEPQPLPVAAPLMPQTGVMDDFYAALEDGNKYVTKVIASKADQEGGAGMSMWLISGMGLLSASAFGLRKFVTPV